MSTYIFESYSLDTKDAVLMHDRQPVPLTPKAFAVLQHLLDRAGHLVTKEELFDALWSGVFVGDAALKVCIAEIRRALDDDPKAPRFIETAHRRGYRFVGQVVREAPAAPPDAPAPATPSIHYARSGDVNIAYQVIGDGPIDLVFVMGWISHLEYFWLEPSFARFLRRLASFSRLILFDKRGTGLSDRVAELPTLEQRMDDVRAVLDAVGSRRAALIGISEGGPMCALFAATHPDKTLALVMCGTYARRTWDPQYPWAPTFEQREHFYREIQEHWGGPVGLEERAPSVANDPQFRAWWASYLRMGASPGAALALTRMNTEADISPVLPSIRVPTLVLHRTGDRCLKVEEGRFVAARIPGAQFVELPGDDHLPFVGDQDALLNHIEQFLMGVMHNEDFDRVLATVMSARVDRDTSRVALERCREQVIARVEWFRGRHLHFSDDGFVATFDGPARAIRCASGVVEVARLLGIDLSVGVHTGECDLSDPPAGPAVDVSAEIARHVPAGEVCVSHTVKDLVAGSGLKFQERLGLPMSRAQSEWRLFAIEQEKGSLDVVRS